MSGEEGWERRYLSRLSDTLADGTILVTPTVLDVDSSHPIVAVDPHIGGSAIPTVASPELRGRRRRDRALDRSGPLPDRVPRRSARSGVGPPARGRLPPRWAAGIRFEPELIQVGGVHRGDRAAPGRGAPRPARAPDRDLRLQRPVGHPGAPHRPRVRPTGAGRPGARRLRQHPGVGADRAAAHHGRPVHPGPRARSRADPHRTDQRTVEPERTERTGAPAAADELIVRRSSAPPAR